jgi:hypothetical protein
MSKELEDIPDKAEGDIADSYMADVQNLPGPGDRETKGYEEYNKMVSKGIAVDPHGLSKYNINAAVDAITDAANREFETTVGSDSWMTKGMHDDMVTFKGMSAREMIYKMEGNAAPEDEEANEGLTEDSEGVGSTKEESDMDKGKQGENAKKPQTGENESFSESGAEEEKGLKKRAASVGGKAVDYLRGYRSMGKFKGRSVGRTKSGKDYIEGAKNLYKGGARKYREAGGPSGIAGTAGEKMRGAGSYLNKNKKKIGAVGAGTALGAGSIYGGYKLVGRKNPNRKKKQ